MSGGAKARKFSILFDWFDRKQDGYLTRDVLQQMAGLFIGLPGGDNPENSQPLRNAFDKMVESAA
jgi:Ca2+-binding EF-hand superfamily protein